jgi:hypothetical protein
VNPSERRYCAFLRSDCAFGAKALRRLRRQAKPEALKAQQQGKGFRGRWALGSLVLHALLLTFAATRPERAPDNTRALVPPAEFAVEVVPSPVAFDDPAADASEPSPRPAPAAALARRRDAPATVGAETEPAAAEQAGPSEGAEEASPADTAGSTTTPRLGLAQLGLTGPNQFLDRAASEPERTPGKRRVDVKRRLDQVLAQRQQDEKTALGLGAGSPVMRALEAAVYGSTAPLNGNARFTFIIDSEGKLVTSSVGDVSSDRDKWERVARQAAQALAQRKLPVPKGKSVRLTVAVTSRLELPSGAAAGDRSTRVDVLNPLDPTAAISLMGDLADLGGKARRMVRSHVVSEELL